MIFVNTLLRACRYRPDVSSAESDASYPSECSAPADRGGTASILPESFPHLPGHKRSRHGFFPVRCPEGQIRGYSVRYIRRVHPQERCIVTLHDISGFKHKEIAELIELPTATVISKYNRAMKKLHIEAQKMGITEADDQYE